MFVVAVCSNSTMFDFFSGQVDMVVIGSGTCGTLTGIARKVKEKVPNCKVSGKPLWRYIEIADLELTLLSHLNDRSLELIH